MLDFVHELAAVSSQLSSMISLVKGMDAMSHEQLRSLTACFAYPILLNNGMDAVKSPNPNGC